MSEIKRPPVRKFTDEERWVLKQATQSTNLKSAWCRKTVESRVEIKETKLECGHWGIRMEKRAQGAYCWRCSPRHVALHKQWDEEDLKTA